MPATNPPQRNPYRRVVEALTRPPSRSVSAMLDYLAATQDAAHELGDEYAVALLRKAHERLARWVPS